MRSQRNIISRTEREIFRIIQKDLVTTRKHSPKNCQSQRDFNKRITVYKQLPGQILQS